MKFHFEPNLNQQLATIKSVAGISGIFQGASYVRPEDRIWQGNASSNILNLPSVLPTIQWSRDSLH